MARKFTKISKEAFKSMQINAGVVLNKFDPTGTTEIQDADIICATSGGVTAECKPNFTDLGADVDNAQKNTAELMQIEDYDCTLSFTALNVTTDVIKLALGAADVSEKKVSPRMTLDPTASTGDFKDIWWVGDYSDANTGDSAGFIAIHMMKALSTGGFQIQSTDRAKGTFAFEYTAHFSMTAQDTVPFELYILVDTASGMSEGESVAVADNA